MNIENDIMVRALLVFKFNDENKVFYPECVSRPSGRYYPHNVPMTRKGNAPSYIWKWEPITVMYSSYMKRTLCDHGLFNMTILILSPSSDIVENWNLKGCRYLDVDGMTMTIAYDDAVRGEENIQYLNSDEYLSYVK